MDKNVLPTPTIKKGREVFAESLSRFAVYGFGRKDVGIKALICVDVFQGKKQVFFVFLFFFHAACFASGTKGVPRLTVAKTRETIPRSGAFATRPQTIPAINLNHNSTMATRCNRPARASVKRSVTCVE